MNLYNQIAFIGIHDQHSTKWHEETAKKCGDIVKEFCFSTMIVGENKINRVLAKSIKKKGGQILGIKFKNENLSETFYYDFLLILDEASDVYLDKILKSCIAVVIIGNPDNLDIKLPIEDIKNIISIDIGTNNCNENCSHHSRKVPVFNSLKKGIIYLLQHNSELSTIEGDYFNMGVQTRYESYPIGEKGEYLKCAGLFLISALKSLLEENHSKWNLSMANYYNSLGDHSYYHENDFLKAASYFSRAYDCLKTGSELEVEYIKEMYYYLISIITECAAFSFDRRIDDQQLAIHAGTKAVQRYKHAILFSNEHTNRCYKHTIVGLEGWIKYLRAKLASKNNDYSKALKHIRGAIEDYQKALNFLPQWKSSGFSDNISVSEKEINELLFEIGVLKPSKILDLISLKRIVEKKNRGEKVD